MKNRNHFSSGFHSYSILLASDRVITTMEAPSYFNRNINAIFVLKKPLRIQTVSEPVNKSFPRYAHCSK